MLTTILDDPTGYGRVVRNGNGSVERVVETKRPGDATDQELAIHEVNTGIFCFDAASPPGRPDQADDRQRPGRALPAAGPGADRRPDRRAHRPRPAPRARRQRPRRPQPRPRARPARDPREPHARGRHVHRPQLSATVDVTVTIAQDVTVEPRTSLKGTTSVETGATVGPDSTLIDTTRRPGRDRPRHVGRPGRRSAPTPSSARSPTCAPARRWAPSPRSARSSRSRTRTSATAPKVPHLSYIGDADVGEDTNLGASTVTANYDGDNKHRTTIGARVKSAVDVTFVAPGHGRRRRLDGRRLGDHPRHPRRRTRGGA